jgi:hypothetical protein
MLSPNLKHNIWLHSSRSLPFVARSMTTQPRASSDSFLLLVPWIAPSLAACALSLLDCLWSARSVAALWITTYYGLRLLSCSSKDHYGSWILRVWDASWESGIAYKDYRWANIKFIYLNNGIDE